MKKWIPIIFILGTIFNIQAKAQSVAAPVQTAPVQPVAPQPAPYPAPPMMPQPMPYNPMMPAGMQPTPIGHIRCFDDMPIVVKARMTAGGMGKYVTLTDQTGSIRGEIDDDAYGSLMHSGWSPAAPSAGFYTIYGKLDCEVFGNKIEIKGIGPAT